MEGRRQDEGRWREERKGSGEETRVRAGGEGRRREVGYRVVDGGRGGEGWRRRGRKKKEGKRGEELCW